MASASVFVPPILRGEMVFENGNKKDNVCLQSDDIRSKYRSIRSLVIREYQYMQSNIFSMKHR